MDRQVKGSWRCRTDWLSAVALTEDAWSVWILDIPIPDARKTICAQGSIMRREINCCGVIALNRSEVLWRISLWGTPIGEMNAFLADVTGVFAMFECRRRGPPRGSGVRRVRSRRGAPGGVCG